MDEFIGKAVKVDCVQEVGWRRPVSVTLGSTTYMVKEVVSHWEEHTLLKAWWRRKHRVRYLLDLDDGFRYELYWDRGAKGAGRGWFMVKRLGT